MGEVAVFIFQSLAMSFFTQNKLKEQYAKLNPAFKNRKYRISREDRFNLKKIILGQKSTK